MSTGLDNVAIHEDVIYPDSDGEPMAEDTLQFRWIVTLQGNLENLFADRPDVFVAGDNFIYPIRGNNAIRLAPDVYVAIGRPKGDRGSYRVWDEGGIFPQVIFEVLSPGNRAGEMEAKREFYERHGAKEYYVIDPDDGHVEGYLREKDRLQEIPTMDEFTSPLLGIRFSRLDGELVVVRPNGERFLTFGEVHAAKVAETQRADQAERQADRARKQADQAKKQAERAEREKELARMRADKLAAKLRELGIDPEES